MNILLAVHGCFQRIHSPRGIMAVPIVGTVMYLLVGLNGGSRKMRQRYEEVDRGLFLLYVFCIPGYVKRQFYRGVITLYDVFVRGKGSADSVDNRRMSALGRGMICVV